MSRDWQQPRAKVDSEGACRACETPHPDAAHIIDRSMVKAGPGEDPRNIVPLCRACHRRYDDYQLDLLPHLTRQEQAYAVELVGLEAARWRITGQRVYQPAATLAAHY